MKIFPSVCPYDCPDTCGLLVTVENGSAVKVQGDPEHTFTRGMLCPKVNHYERTVHSPRRLTTPLLRSGAKGEARFIPVSWDVAISHIAAKWQQIIAKYGAEAILPYSYAGTMGLVQRNVGHPFFYRLGASRLERTICSSAKRYGWATVMGDSACPHHREIPSADLVILWGSNALATNIHILNEVKAAKKNGATVWLIDTYETPTAVIADRTVVIRPGTDGALALGLMHILARDNLIDRNFIDKHVIGYDMLARDILPEYPPDRVSDITGISTEIIEELARLYAASTPYIHLGSGLSRYTNGAAAVRAITCLPAIVGAWAKLGGGLFVSAATNKFFDSGRITREDFSKNSRIINMNQLGAALNEPLSLPIMSLYVYHSNPAVVAPDQNQVLRGLAREDLFTVVHERFMTDTAKYADVVLPATSSLEHGDLYRSYGHYSVQRAYPIIPPVGQSKSNWEVFKLLAEAMGFDDDFFRQSVDDLVNALLASPSPRLSAAQIEQLAQGRPVEIELPEGYKTAFATPSGKIEIFNPRETSPLPDFTPPHGDSGDFWLINSPDIRLLNSSFNERDDLLGNDIGTLQINPADADAHSLHDKQIVTAYNERGAVDFIVKISDKVPPKVVVAEGVLWLEHTLNNSGINALTSQRLTDKADGSTFYDVKISIRPHNA